MKAIPEVLGAGLVTIALVLMSLPRPAGAGDITTSCFLPGDQGSCTRPVLQHVEFKSVVTEFVDPQNTGIGHSLSRLLWREILSSIWNVAGAGVILAHDAEDQMRQALEGRDYLDYLETDYHEAAMQIARSLDVQMSLWGMVLEQDDVVFVQPFLTILPTESDPWTQLRVASPATKGVELTAPLTHDRLNFALVETDRNSLFARRFATRCALKAGCPRGVPVREGPSNEHAIVGYVPAGRSVQAVDMVEQWFRIERPGSQTAYINIYHLEMTPRSVHSPQRSNVNMRTGPGASDVLGRVALSGDYDVIDVGKDDRGRLWYRVEADGRDGWIASWLFKPNFSFPAVHFIEGLYRYARHDFDGSVAALTRFIARSGRDSNVTLSAAHQFLAAARLARPTRGRDTAIEPALQDLDEAVALTPFDPRAYVLRSLVHFGSARAPDEGLDDLERALDLDMRNTAARTLLRDLDQLDRQYGIERLSGDDRARPTLARRLSSLRQQYP